MKLSRRAQRKGWQKGCWRRGHMDAPLLDDITRRLLEVQTARPRRRCSSQRWRSTSSAPSPAKSSSDSPTSSSSRLPSISASGGFFRGYTKVCKGLAVILLLVHLVVQLILTKDNPVFLEPDNCWLEQTIPGEESICLLMPEAWCSRCLHLCMQITAKVEASIF